MALRYNLVYEKGKKKHSASVIIYQKINKFKPFAHGVVTMQCKKINTIPKEVLTNKIVQVSNIFISNVRDLFRCFPIA